MTEHTMTLANRINELLRPIPKWLVFVVGALPGFYIIAGVALALTGTYDLFGTSLGVDPAKGVEHWTGELALQFFIATMTISFLRNHFKLKLIKFRRPLGLLTYFYVSLHLLIWIGLDLQLRWGEVWGDILKRPYITIGMVAFVMLTPMAITSSNYMIKKLGPLRWQKLHKLGYVAIILGGVHYVMVQKVWEREPLIYLGIILFLMGMRYVHAKTK